MKYQNKISLLFTLILIGLISTGNLFSQMRNITGYELVDDMKIGWNLGNSFDSLGGDETAWGNPVTTKAIIDMIASKGFKTVRIPVSWGEHVGPGPSYTIDPQRLSRVKTVVDYCMANSMYAIVNMHHENEWLVPTYAKEAESTKELLAIWKQIAEYFRNYDDYLLFETMNEPRVEGSAMEWNGGTEENRDVINHFNQVALDTIRSTGGNNSKRWVLITPHAATSMDIVIRNLAIPNDPYILVSQHTYYPYFFCLDTGGTAAWGTEKDKIDMDLELDRVADFWKAKGIPVVVGEWASIEKNNTAARVAHAEYYAGGLRNRGMLGIWWDNGWTGDGGLAILDRKTLTWHRPEIADALIKGVNQPQSSPFPGYDCSALPEWSASTVYSAAGAQVRYNGKMYENRWYTSGENPEENSGSNEVWIYIGPCAGGLTPDTPSPTPVPDITPTPVDRIMGDVDRSGAVNVVDSLLIAQYYVNQIPAVFYPEAADVNCDNSINIVDALLVAQYYVSLISKFPC
ncbi:MAG: cellulase family glycosylhydrolase [Spirochaetales bacterium]|nr:cellulase family glycosylhydrolase [Spirochaetales bacterium]